MIITMLPLIRPKWLTLTVFCIQTPNKSLYEMKWHNGIYAIKLLYDGTGKIVGRVIL